MIAKTTLCLIVITTTCQTAIQFARGDDCCYCCQNTDHSYIMQSTREISTCQGGSIILPLKLSRSTARGQIKNVNIRIQNSYSNIRTEYEYSNIRTFVDILSKWSEREMWSLANLTLNGTLPIHLIEVLRVSKTGKGNERLQLSGVRYFKLMSDGTNNFTTQLVSHNGMFTSFNGTESSNADLVKKAGLQAHVNCSPYLAHVKANLQSKVRAEFKNGTGAKYSCTAKTDFTKQRI